MILMRTPIMRIESALSARCAVSITRFALKIHKKVLQKNKSCVQIPRRHGRGVVNHL